MVSQLFFSIFIFLPYDREVVVTGNDVMSVCVSGYVCMCVCVCSVCRVVTIPALDAFISNDEKIQWLPSLGPDWSSNRHRGS